MNHPFSIRFPVRFRDIDALGHVNNAVYFTYMESARTEYWKRLFEVSNLGGISFIVVHAECDFRTPAHEGDEIEVSIRTSEIRNTSFVWDYVIRNAGDSSIHASGKTIQVYYDHQQQTKLPIPEAVRAKLLGESRT